MGVGKKQQQIFKIIFHPNIIQRFTIAQFSLALKSASNYVHTCFFLYEKKYYYKINLLKKISQN